MTPTLPTVPEFQTLIAGRSQPATRLMEVRSPATGEVVGRVPNHSEADVDLSVAHARTVQKAWAALSAYQREAAVRRATAHVRTQAAEIGRLMALEQGKPLAQAQSEVVGSCDTLDYYAAEGVRLEGYISPTEAAGLRSSVTYHPVGVCALITPWNYPLSLLSWKLGPALAAGNAAVVKPSPVTPMCTLAFCKALEEGGLPAGLVQVLTGSEAGLGAALVSHAGVDKVAMTGATATGKRILESVAASLKKVTLELGGHCPAIVCADADVKLAARVIAYKGFRNMGQSCSSVNRVYAHASLVPALLEALVQEAQALSIGDGLSDPMVDLGPMATLEALEKVRRHVADALERGAVLHTGGAAPEGEAYAHGHFYRPTVLSSVPDDALMMCEETFGPVVPVSSFDSLDEAIARANDSQFGLAAYVFARDYGTITRVSEALEAGTVCVNNGAVNTNYGPYEGWKDSGYGLELSRRGILEYVKVKHVKVQLI